MAVRAILKWPSSKLRQVCDPVSDLSEAESIARDLCDTMKVNFGAGLAASQVGVKKSIVVINDSSIRSLKPCSRVQGVCVLINPTIEVVGKEKFKWTEACLSVRDQSGTVSRYSNIVLTYQNLDGETVVKNLRNEDAGIVQHEVDHLSGRLFVDLLPSLEKRMIFNRLRKKFKKKKREATAAKKEHSAEMRKHLLRKKRKKRPPKKYGKRKK